MKRPVFSEECILYSILHSPITSSFLGQNFLIIITRYLVMLAGINSHVISNTHRDM